LKTIHDRLVASARTNLPYRPLFYNLGDEPGIADLAAFWDFDYSDPSLSAFRSWLVERYGTMAALKQQRGTAFPRWDGVMPETTNEATKRTDHNFSSWSDFKEWMDVAFARALKAGSAREDWKRRVCAGEAASVRKAIASSRSGIRRY
jgi:hypothetical protein